MTTKITVESIRAWAEEQGLLPTPGPARTSSREVSFPVALEYVAPFLANVPATPPAAFSPSWLAEPDEQLRFVAVLVAAVQWALHTEIRQRATVDAAQEIAAAVKATAPTPASSARYVESDAAQPPFDYPPRRRAA